MIATEQIAQIAIDAIGLVIVFTFIAMIGSWVTTPQKFIRLTVKFSMLPRTTAERERVAKRSDRIAYYYFGTTGDKDRDEEIARFDTVYGRTLGVAAVLGVFALIAFAALSSRFS